MAEVLNSSGASIRTWFHQGTATFTHLIRDSATGKQVIIDPVMDYDPASGRYATDFIDEVLEAAEPDRYPLEYLLETHAHADHLSAADYLRKKTGAQILIGEPIQQVQKVFGALFHEPSSFVPDGRQFDRLLKDGDRIALGESDIQVIATPGHTPACMSYFLNQTHLFVGDTLFMPDVGTARCDFPGGDAATLYHSIQRLLSLGDQVIMHFCHDYPPEGRAMCSFISVAEQKAENIHVGKGISEAEFVALRKQRDAQLSVPKLIAASLQTNIRAGALPEAETNGVSYFKMPINQLSG